jgi:transposase
MAGSLLLPLPEGLSINEVAQESGCLLVSVSAVHRHVPCPFCQALAERIHSRYQRIVADMSCGGQRVLFQLTVRKFFWHNVECPYTLFAERFPGLVQAYARMTERLIATLQALGLALTGEGGARLARIFAMPTSADTILRRVLDLPLPESEHVSIVGVDDWAWRKGQRYGSILVDLARHRVVGLLEERSSASVRDWLQAHPEVEAVSRDRGIHYSEGATQGAPQAVQIADRWHLLHNLREIVEQVLNRHRAALHVVHPVRATPDPDWRPPLVKRDETLRLARRAQRYATFERVLELDRQGWRSAQIAHEVGVSVQSVSRYLNAHHSPERYRRKRRSRLGPYLPYLRQRWDEGCHNTSHLWRELQEQGFAGSRALVASYVACLRHPDLLRRPEAEAAVHRSFVPRKAVWLFLRDPEGLTAIEQADLLQIQSNCPETEHLYQLAQAFWHPSVQRFGLALDGWMSQAHASNLPEFRRFAESLQSDLSAIRAALHYPWSSGQVEGQINRLKAIKRQMYGRAQLPLLARHVLLAA